MRILLLLTFCALPALAEKIIKSDHIQVRLLQSQKSLNKSQALHVAVHYTMDPEWHIYWKNPGDSGASPKFKVEGGKLTNIRWPYPSRIPIATLTNYGYEHETAILLDIEPQAQDLKLKLEWLVCKVECVPGFGEFDINLSKLETTDEQRKLYEKYVMQIPEAAFDWKLETTDRTSDYLEVKLSSASGSLDGVSELFVYPEDGENFLTKAPKIELDKAGAKIQIPLSPNAKIQTAKTPLTFVLIRTDMADSFDIEADYAPASPDLIWGLIFAFLGGLSLNVMPCVFPVLSLKVFGFLKETDARKTRHSGWAYTAGVLATFLVIGGILSALRYSGEAVGWGYQLQSPWFTYVLAFLFLVLAFNFWGLFEMGEGIANFSGRFANSKLLAGGFGSGVLAVVVASPCTAPFMGGALGLTLLLPWYDSLLIFFSLGVGMALPMLLLSHLPFLISFLPRSGRWMEIVKKAMAVPLALTALWLLTIHLSIFPESEKSRAWSSYNSQTLTEKQKSQPVFVDFTASWCITCQVNKKAVLETDEVQDIFKKNNVYLVRADWTNQDSEITKALASFDRNSVPLYVFYNGSERPKILPQLLTRDMIVELFEKGE